MTSTELALREATQSAIQQLDQPEYVAEIESALPEGVSLRQFIRALKSALITDPRLADPALRSSFLQVGIRLAQMGLRADDNEAHLEVYSTKDGPKVQLMPMIAGLRKIAATHGWMITAEVVYENDQYDPDVENHRVNWSRPKLGQDRGEPVGAFALAEHRDGRKFGPLDMDKADIERVRAVSKAKNGKLWTTWWDRAWKKTVARALFKDLPLDPADKRVVGLRTALDSDPADAIYGEIGQERRGLPSSSLGSPHAPKAGEAPHSTTASPADTPDEDPADPVEPTEEELDAMVAAEEAEEPEVVEGDAVEEEGGEEPVVVTAKGDSKYEGQTVQQIWESGKHGQQWVKWALSTWKREPFRAALLKWATEHPEAL